MYTKIKKVETPKYVYMSSAQEASILWTNLQRNRVVVNLVREEGISSEYQQFDDFVEAITQFCNSNNKGLWTFEHTERAYTSGRPTPKFGKPDAIRGHATVFFEMLEDQAKFLEYLTTLKLAN